MDLITSAKKLEWLDLKNVTLRTANVSYYEEAKDRIKMSGNECVLELNQGENLENTLFSVKKGDAVKFLPGPSLYGCDIKLYTELPTDPKSFKRGDYRPIEVGKPVLAQLPGSFRYYFTLHGSAETDGCGYLHVEPELHLEGERLPANCVQCLTVLSKCLGHHNSWLDRLALGAQSGYNMIHFAPVQKLGASKSSYCIQDQLKLNTNFGDEDQPMTWKQLGNITDTLRSKHMMLSICDIVLNHSANESSWLRSHPECTYNLDNSPHLRPAYLLDLALVRLSSSASRCELESVGIPSVIDNEAHLSALRHHLKTVALPSLRLHQMYTVDVQKLVSKFQFLVTQREPYRLSDDSHTSSLRVVQDPLFRRLTSTIDMDDALQIFNVYRTDCYDEDTRRKRCAESFKACLDDLNSKIQAEMESHLEAAAEACIANARYFRVQQDGPRLKEISKKHPLFPRYFYDGTKEGSEENAFDFELCRLVWAHNGWVMNYDPLLDFAQPGSNVYLRRELIPWGDSVKLRYGEKEEDCPFLWSHMKKYVEETAKVFDGVRLDNCHSTPIKVAQYLLDAARKIKPDLYVVAELFTNSDLTDNVFVNKLGITALIRECMSGWDSHEVGRLVYRYGGGVIGSLQTSGARRLANALFLDLTHDNPHPVEKRSLYDMIPSSALVAMATCATGSTMGYDQLVPHHIHVVEEGRLYMSQTDSKLNRGIMDAKLALNKLHFSLAQQGYSQVFVDQVDGDIVCVTRFNPCTLESVVIFCYTAFSWPNDTQNGGGKGITVSGIAHSIILETYLEHTSGARYVKPDKFLKDDTVLNGLENYRLVLRENVSLEKCSMLQATPTGTSIRISLTDHFKPGSVVAIKIVSRSLSKTATEKLRAPILDLEKIVAKLNLAGLNFCLYRCGGEGGPLYEIPGFGHLIYQGLQGPMSVLFEIAAKDDLGHPICANIRAGPWLGEYLVKRLKANPSTQLLGDEMEKYVKLLEELPMSLKPWGFYRVVSQVHTALLSRAISLMSMFVQEGSELVRCLALVSVQMTGEVTRLPPLSERLASPTPPLVRDPNGGTLYQMVTTLAAGLPHFSSGLMRCWGRDTFISLRGLLLLTGRHQEARYQILGFGGCLRHGLIPNLLDGEGLKPRFNCRDAVWWWLHSIKEYTRLVPRGGDILKDLVNRIFPKDDSQPSSVDQPLTDVIQEALSIHFQGLVFRERNAGHQIDEHMTSEGFDNQIGIHPKTGFVFGGNEWNCGTWMDKMGSSVTAGTKGRPATPRDGSAVEMVGLQYSVISWLASLHNFGEYPHPGVTRLSKNGDTTTWSWSEWADKIRANFELEFWVGPTTEGEHIFRRNIYKDSVGATHHWADLRLRPNFTVAMVVAPELFSPAHAAAALETAKLLEGPLGMKTLDPGDLAYCGSYDNDNHTADARVAHGFNYHQGPEWLWLTGYYLRARLLHDPSESVMREVKSWLSRLYRHLVTSPWRGLPELTNEGGVYCPHSSPTQAWSAATILETLHDLKKIQGFA